MKIKKLMLGFCLLFVMRSGLIAMQPRAEFPECLYKILPKKIIEIYETRGYLEPFGEEKDSIIFIEESGWKSCLAKHEEENNERVFVVIKVAVNELGKYGVVDSKDEKTYQFRAKDTQRGPEVPFSICDLIALESLCCKAIQDHKFSQLFKSVPNAA